MLFLSPLSEDELYDNVNFQRFNCFIFDCFVLYLVLSVHIFLLYWHAAFFTEFLYRSGKTRKRAGCFDWPGKSPKVIQKQKFNRMSEKMKYTDKYDENKTYSLMNNCVFAA